MKRDHVLTALFFAITVISFYLFYQIIIPFFIPICWAAVFTILFSPLYERICKRIKSRGIASGIVCLLIVILIIGPVTYLFIALVDEAIDAVGWVNELYRSGKLDELLTVDIPIVTSMKEKLAAYNLSEINLDELAKDAVNRVSGVIVSQTTWLVTNGTKAVFYFALMVFTMYYFFKEGWLIIEKLKQLMPLPARQVNSTFAQLKDIIHATIYGGVVVALLQGILGGILFLAVGITSPVFWGAIMAFLAIIPFVGAFLIYVPAGIILMIGGSYVKGMVVILVGSLVISQVDNLVRPYLIASRAAMHPLLLFFCILGGIYLFGLLGLVLGPMIGAMFMIFLKIFEFTLHPESATVETDA